MLNVVTVFLMIDYLKKIPEDATKRWGVIILRVLENISTSERRYGNKARCKMHCGFEEFFDQWFKICAYSRGPRIAKSV